MKVLFLGDTVNNGGPANANRELVEHWPSNDEVIVVYNRNRLVEIAYGILLGLTCDVVVSTEGAWPDIIIHAVLSHFGKPVVTFLHGYLPYENEVDGLGCSHRKIEAYKNHLRRSQAIVANSTLQLKLVMEALGQSRGDSASVDLGIPRFKVPASPGSPRHPMIAVSGGNRPIKGNVAVAKAVRELIASGTPCKLLVFGGLNPGHRELLDVGQSIGALFMGHVPHDMFMKSLEETSVFVMNSLHDSFGLSAIDAISSGASILLSRSCGVCDVFELKDCDVIQNQEDVVEIKKKIAYLIDHPNAERLAKTIDFEKYSWENSSNKLRDICAKAAGRA